MNKKDYYKKNKDIILNRAKEYYKNNKDFILNRSKEYYKKKTRINKRLLKTI